MSKMVSFIEITDRGYTWHVPADTIADNRAKYYSGMQSRNSDMYQAEYNYAINDPEELLDWVKNNMDWDELKPTATLVQTPVIITRPELSNANYTIIEK